MRKRKGPATPGREKKSVNVHQAKTHLSRLLRKVAAGEEIVIARGGTPVAKLVPYAERPARRVLGQAAGLGVRVADDFDELPKRVLRSFEQPL